MRPCKDERKLLVVFFLTRSFYPASESTVFLSFVGRPGSSLLPVDTCGNILEM